MTTQQTLIDNWSNNAAVHAATTYNNTFRRSFPNAPSNVPARTVLEDLRDSLYPVIRNELLMSWATEVDGRVTKVFSARFTPTATPTTATANVEVALKIETDIQNIDPQGRRTAATEIRFETLSAGATATWDVPSQTWIAR